MNIPSSAQLSSSRRVQDLFLHTHFENMLQRWGESSPQRTNLHASSVLVPDSEWCSRAHILVNTRPEEAAPIENHSWLNAIFLHGWQIHIKWQNIFKQFGRVVMRGHDYCLDLTHHHEQYNLYYSPDAILEIMGEWWVCEIKGINTEEFSRAANLPLEEAILASETVKKARVQVTLYMHLLGVEKGMVLAEDKNNQQYRLWSVGYDETLIAPYLARLKKYSQEAREYRENALLPTRHRLCKTALSPRARRCPMRGLCFEIQEEGA